MANIKTAISIEKPLFEDMEALAEELDVSRSHLFSLAAQEFIRRHKNQKLLEAINEAHKEPPIPSEEDVQKLMRAKQRKMVQGEW